MTTAPTDPPIEDRRLRTALLRWYRRSRRDLPWRRTGDPYRIWVSEVMLQQTQVATVLPYYDRFLRRFPDVVSLARAHEEEVLALWSGLGYYRRARLLQAGARAVVERHDGQLPRDPEALRALPGVGRYTAGAIASIAFNLPEPIVDGNVRRVLSRLYELDGSRTEKRLWELSATLVRGPRPGDLNQALMELGATICLPTRPRCPRCPIRLGCRASANGEPENYPVRRPKPAVRRVHAAAAVIRRGRRILLERPGELSPLRGSWDLPAIELDPEPAEGPADGGAAAIRAHMARHHGLELELGEPVGRVSHGIMNRRLTLTIHAGRHRGGRASGSPDLRWIDPAELRLAAVSGATHKILAALIQADRAALDATRRAPKARWP